MNLFQGVENIANIMGWKVRSGWLLTLIFLSGNLAQANPLFEKLEIKEPPTKEAWKGFHSLNSSNRMKIWEKNTKSGIQLGDWAWQWRIAWIRQCSQADTGACQQILQVGLTDRAMVVRAETASQYGSIYDGSHRSDIIERLKRAYGEAENYRKGKPLFVQKRILFAILKVGGEGSLSTGQNVSQSHPQTRLYWEKISAPVRQNNSKKF